LVWNQVYDPLGNAALSTILAAVPIVVLLALLGIFNVKAHFSAMIALLAALLVAVLAFGMPASMALITAVYGVCTGLFPIGWIILNVIFLYQLTLHKGLFKVMQDSLTTVTEDRRLQLLLIAFSFGAFFEGASGFGTPVAVTGAILIGLGFSPLAASGLSLIANTAPVAYGALGTPIIGLQQVTGLDLFQLSAMVGRQLPFFSLLVPFWLIWAFAGFRGMLGVWPAVLVAGLFFAIPQFLVSNYHGPWLVDVVASVVSMAALIVFLRFWKPKQIWTSVAIGREASSPPTVFQRHSRDAIIRAWVPWLILAVFAFLWGLQDVRAWLNGFSNPVIDVPGLDNLIQRVAPVVPKPTPERARFFFNWLSATGSGILLAAVVAGFAMKISIGQMIVTYGTTLRLVRFSLLTIAAMLAIGIVTRYSGLDATLGLAFARTGVLYPFFAAMLGWLGVAMTGSDTASNVLFGSLQKISAEQLGINPVLAAAANSSGGVMGKMIDAQSIVVASTATRWYGHEGEILRYVFFHSLALAALMGGLIMLQAYVPPFTLMVIGGH
jgi:lactate permease